MSFFLSGENVHFSLACFRPQLMIKVANRNGRLVFELHECSLRHNAIRLNLTPPTNKRNNGG
jgi:hypothetical protein